MCGWLLCSLFLDSKRSRLPLQSIPSCLCCPRFSLFVDSAIGRVHRQPSSAGPAMGRQRLKFQRAPSSCIHPLRLSCPWLWHFSHAYLLWAQFATGGGSLRRPGAWERCLTHPCGHFPCQRTCHKLEDGWRAVRLQSRHSNDHCNYRPESF